MGKRLERFGEVRIVDETLIYIFILRIVIYILKKRVYIDSVIKILMNAKSIECPSLIIN